jgi:hypothetical protein
MAYHWPASSIVFDGPRGAVTSHSSERPSSRLAVYNWLALLRTQRKVEGLNI